MTQTTPTSIPYNGSGTINIHVNNPSANLGGMPSMPAPMPYVAPMPYPMYVYPPNYYNIYNNYYAQPSPYAQQSQTQATTPQNIAGNGQLPRTLQDNTGMQAQAASAVAASAAASAKDKPKQRQIVILTDEYVKNLENYLKNPNSEVRKFAAKELLDRFKEDKSRINNPSLTALLNIALMDSNPTVRAGAMSILNSGYAKGNQLTEQIMKNLQNSKTDYSTEAIQAADSLLKMSQNKALVTDNSHYLDQNINTNKKGK